MGKRFNVLSSPVIIMRDGEKEEGRKEDPKERRARGEFSVSSECSSGIYRRTDALSEK